MLMKIFEPIAFIFKVSEIISEVCYITSTYTGSYTLQILSGYEVPYLQSQAEMALQPFSLFPPALMNYHSIKQAVWHSYKGSYITKPKKKKIASTNPSHKFNPVLEDHMYSSDKEIYAIRRNNSPTPLLTIITCLKGSYMNIPKEN